MCFFIFFGFIGLCRFPFHVSSVSLWYGGPPTLDHGLIYLDRVDRRFILINLTLVKCDFLISLSNFLFLLVRDPLPFQTHQPFY